MKLNVSAKIGAGLGTVFVMLVLASVAGYMATARLTQSLDFIMGPAWTTADGAMEGIIAVQRQIIATEEMAAAAFQGEKRVPASLAAAEREADDAFGRMLDAGQVPQRTAERLKGDIRTFTAARDALVGASERYQGAYQAMNEHAQKLVEFMGRMEDLGDGAVEALEREPQRQWRWGELQERWEAADGSMEARIALLSQLRVLQRMLTAERDISADLTAWSEDLAAQSARLAQLRLFAQPVPDGEFAGRPHGEVFRQLTGEHQKRIAAAVTELHAFKKANAHFLTAAHDLQEGLVSLEEVTDGAVEREEGHVALVQSEAIGGITAALVAGLVAFIAAYLFVARAVARPLREVAERLHEIATGDGDLTETLPERGGDEIGDIARCFNEFIGKLRDLIGRIADATDQLGSASVQLAEITDHTRRNLDRQQSGTDQVATAMNEMSATVHEVANSAGGASDAADHAHQAAARGRKVVSEAVAGIQTLANEVQSAAAVIDRLNAESDNISTVLDVIRGVAEQTNLLALNAAIEAARAGEQGRGFAVVADEVRTLAQRAHKSTEEIQAMIESLQRESRRAVEAMEKGREQAGAGVQRVQETGEVLGDVAAAVDRINDMNHQVASATEEQSAVADDINRNIVTIKQLADETGEVAAQTAAAGAELRRLADGLKGLVGQFKV